MKFPFPIGEISWLRFQIEAGEGSSMGLAEIVVHGGQQVILPQLPPNAPRKLKVSQEPLLLTWENNPEPYLGGYRIYYGTSPKNYTQVLDAGNVNRFLMTSLVDGVTYYFALKAYSLTGKTSPGFSNEAKATFYAPHVDTLSPAQGSTSGVNRVTINGSHFKGSTVLFGGSHAQILNISPTVIEVLTPAHLAGPVEVVVINSDGSRSKLPQGFTYVKQ